MKALVLEDYNRLVYKDVAEPVLKDDEVLIEVKAVGICGSDVHGTDGSTGRRIPPIIMGHEASGIIVETGSGLCGSLPTGTDGSRLVPQACYLGGHRDLQGVPEGAQAHVL